MAIISMVTPRSGRYSKKDLPSFPTCSTIPVVTFCATPLVQGKRLKIKLINKNARRSLMAILARRLADINILVTFSADSIS